MSEAEAPPERKAAGEAEVRLEREGPLARIVLSHPARRNALTWAMYDQLAAACERLAADESVRVVVLRGDGGQAFAAGTDIRVFTDFTGPEDGVAYEHRIAAVHRTLLELPVPVIAVVEGPAVGGGLTLATLCDLVYCTPDAVFGAPIARTVGHCEAPDTMARMMAGFGRRLAMEMLLTGRLAGAEEAYRAGFVTEVVPRERLDARVAEVVERVLGCAPLSLAAFKELARRIDRALGEVDADDVYRRVYASADFREGVAAFLAKRRPQWSGR